MGQKFPFPSRVAQQQSPARSYRPSRSPPVLSKFALAVKLRRETYTPKRIDVSSATWVVACVRAGDEAVAAESLSGLGFLAYVPAKRIVVHRARAPRGKRVRRDQIVPLFSRYLFVGEVHRELDRYDCDKVVAVLRGSPKAVAHAVDQINIAECAGQFDYAPKSRRWEQKSTFKRHDSVRVNEGPFSGFFAVVEEINAQGIIQISLDIFGRQTKIRLEAGQIEAAVV